MLSQISGVVGELTRGYKPGRTGSTMHFPRSGVDRERHRPPLHPCSHENRRIIPDPQQLQHSEEQLLHPPGSVEFTLVAGMRASRTEGMSKGELAPTTCMSFSDMGEGEVPPFAPCHPWQAGEMAPRSSDQEGCPCPSSPAAIRRAGPECRAFK